MIVPSTDVILLKVPLELDNLNQLTFANKTAQYNYFTSLPKLPFDDFTYQRKDGILRLPALVDDIEGYNYVMYRNEGYTDKWFYAFIDSMEYVNDNVTHAKIRTDTWQTWQFDLDFKPTFVAREHTNDDTIGANTVPENVETGEPVTNGQIIHMAPNSTGNFVCFMVSDVGPINKTWDSSNQYNGIFSGYFLFGVDSFDAATQIVNCYIDETKIDAIKNVFMCPKLLFGTPTTSIIDTLTPTVTIYYPQKVQAPIALIENQTINRINTLDGYTPKNDKLYTWPYSYLFVTNNVGGDAEYRYEDFYQATPHFRMSGIVTSGCDIKLNPLNYKNVTTSNEAYGLKLGKIPICSWNSDSYAVWLAQNQLNMQVSLTRNTLKTVAGVATKNYEMAASGVGSYLGDVLNSMSESFLAKHLPDEVHGNPNSSDYNFSAGLFIDVRRMSVRAEYARIIDDYFSAFGYATNRVKLPNITGRRNWNYVKTIACYIKADIPQGDLQEIKSMFDKGITLWHNPATFADYSQNNDII